MLMGRGVIMAVEGFKRLGDIMTRVYMVTGMRFLGIGVSV